MLAPIDIDNMLAAAQDQLEFGLNDKALQIAEWVRANSTTADLRLGAFLMDLDALGSADEVLARPGLGDDHQSVADFFRAEIALRQGHKERAKSLINAIVARKAPLPPVFLARLAAMADAAAKDTAPPLVQRLGPPTPTVPNDPNDHDLLLQMSRGIRL